MSDLSGTYRDSIATVSAGGERQWLYPQQPEGRHYERRKLLSYLLLAVLVGLPFVEIGGQPLFRFDVLGRDFRLFGIGFGPQDFYLAGLTMVTAIVTIALFTVVFGRLFCGWICPQTIFMEMVFRRVEYAIDGTPAQQRRLARSSWTGEKIRKRILKHAIFFAIAVGIAHLFLSYVIGWREVYRIASEPVAEHWVGLLALLSFSLVFYAVFARLREQVCTSICPYGRLQSVLVDDDTVGVAYDESRGEPRGKVRRGAAESSPRGDCIDCGLCVRVCPTGIDIRDGFNQLECVHCTACIDACDTIMERVDRPRGLIRHDSRRGLTGRKRKLFTRRSYAYAAVLVALVSLNATLLVLRSPVQFTVARAAGVLPVPRADGTVANLYQYRIANKTDDTLRVALDATLDARAADVRWVGQPPVVAPDGEATGAFFVDIRPTGSPSRVVDLTLSLRAAPSGKTLDVAEPTFTFGNPIRSR